jgi:hypothetical protein
MAGGPAFHRHDDTAGTLSWEIWKRTKSWATRQSNRGLVPSRSWSLLAIAIDIATTVLGFIALWEAFVFGIALQKLVVQNDVEK